MSVRRLLSASIAASILCTTAVHAQPAAPTTSVTLDGVTYELTTVLTSYDASASLLQSQVWWGDTTLADNLIAAIRYNLGDFESNYPAVYPSSANPSSALLAYSADELNNTYSSFW